MSLCRASEQDSSEHNVFSNNGVLPSTCRLRAALYLFNEALAWAGPS